MLYLDMTNPVARLHTGMRNALVNEIRTSNIDVLNVITKRAYSADTYEFLKNDLPQLLVNVHFEEEIDLSGEDIVFSIFNKVNKNIRHALKVTFIWDLTATRFGSDEQRRIARDQLEETINNSDYIYTATETVKNQIIREFHLHSNKIKTVCLNVPRSAVGEPDALNRQSVSKQKTIIYPAAFREHKNHKVLIKAMVDLPNAKLVLTCGEKHGVEQRSLPLFELIEKLELADRVTVLGYLDPEEYLQLLNSADILCFPSLSEGWGLPPLEAMSTGTPVVAAYTSIIPEVLGNAVEYFNPFCEISVARSIRNALSHKRSRELIGLGRSRLLELDKSAADNGLIHSLQKLVEHVQLDLAYEGRFSGYSRNWQVLAKFGRADKCQEMEPLFNDIERRCTGVVKRPVERKKPEKIHLYMNVSRLFDGNLKSGIARYIISIINILQNDKYIELNLFFDPLARGYRESKAYRYRYLSIGGSNIRCQHINDAIDDAMGLDGSVVWHSPYHPLPRVRYSKFSYVQTICDIFHLSQPFYYPAGQHLVTADIVDRLRPRDRVIVISSFSGADLWRYVPFVDTSLTPLAPSISKIDGETQFLTSRSEILVPYQGDSRKRFTWMFRVAKVFAEKVDAPIGVYGKISRMPSSLRKELLDSDRVSIYNEPDDEFLSLLFQRSKIMLYMSDLEGFGIPPLEAATYGCIPVVTKFSAMAEVYADYPFSVSDVDGEDGVISILEAAWNTDTNKVRNLLGDLSNKYKWSSVGAAHIAAYLEALNEHEETRNG